MTEKRFTSNGQWIAEGTIVDICDNGKVIMQVFDNDNIQNVVDLLNEQQSRIKELEKENDDLRTTITKQVEAITEMKGIIYMFQGLRIEEYSSEIEDNMVKLQKAYDGNLEDFLNYFKDGCFDE